MEFKKDKGNKVDRSKEKKEWTRCKKYRNMISSVRVNSVQIRRVVSEQVVFKVSFEGV